MKKWLLVIAASLLILTSVVGCTSQADGATENGDSELKVGLVLTGSKTDGGWCQIAYEGLVQMQDELGAEIFCSEGTKLTDFEKVMKGYAEDGCNIVIGHGFEFGDAAEIVAEQYPDTQFIVTSSKVENGTNLSSLSYKNAEVGFLQGAFAGLMSKTGTAGYIIGTELPQMVVGMNTYIGGMQYINPAAVPLTAATGSMDDASKLKEQAIAFIDQGADILIVNANAAGRGGFDAAKDKGIYCVGSISVDYDANPAAIACGEVDFGTGLFQMAEDYVAGTLEGKNYVKGVADNVVVFTYSPNLESEIPDSVKNKMEEIREQMTSGELKAEDYTIEK